MTTDLTHRDVRADLRDVIERAILSHPRSLQTEIGPSEIGTPCTRKLGHKLAGTPPVRPEVAAWRPTVGTAVHSWLEAAFTAENAALGWDRWALELRVHVGDIGVSMITGRCDLYDRLTGTVVDWKVPGVSTIKAARAAQSPGPQYRVQAHLYGRGFVAFGFVVNAVAIYYLPAAGELADGYYWTEPYDEQVAIDALQRADGIALGLDLMGPSAVLPQLLMSPDHCNYCPFFAPGASDLVHACPGAAMDNPVRQTSGPAFGRVATTERNA